MTAPPPCAAPDPRPRKPRNAVPGGACDCHIHVFDRPSTEIAERSYSAPPAPLARYRNVQAALGLDRAVIVQPSVYGTDNQTTLASLPKDGSMKAVVVVDDDTPTGQLTSLARHGVVGARVNLLFSSNAKVNNLAGLARNLADLGWHLQLLMDISAPPDLERIVADLPVPVVFDHFGHVPPEKAPHDPGFQTLLTLLERGDVWVKLSGAYRLSQDAAGHYDDVAPMAKALVAANPDRLVWGSDWPHPSFTGQMPNDADLLDLLFDWVGAEMAHRILVRNPEQLYGFPPWKPVP